MISKENAADKLTDGGFDAGLTLLAAITPRGVELTLDEIAFVCGCNRQDIWHIEKRAKQKLKIEFERRGLNNFFDFNE